MKKQTIFKILSLILFLTGISLIINSQITITGAVIGVSISPASSLIIGNIFFLTSIILFLTSTLEERIKEERIKKPDRRQLYFKNRADELLRYKSDAWIPRWELEELKEEFKSRGLEVNVEESHYGGHTGPIQKHINIYTKKGETPLIKKHLFITDDPYNPLIEKVGYTIEHKKAKKVKSKYYSPKMRKIT